MAGKKKKTSLKYSEMCLYCAKFDMNTQKCSAKKEKVSPRGIPEELNCAKYKMSDDAKFAFSDDAISYYENNPWADFKRNALLKKYQESLEVRM